jgi:hypothetical protein
VCSEATKARPAVTTPLGCIRDHVFRNLSTDVCCHVVAGLPNDQDNGFGGGIVVYSGCTDGCLIDGNTFTSNSVPKGDGGGFYAAAPATMVVTNNVFTENVAGAAFGALLDHG